MDEKITVVIADDHPLYREGVSRTLSDFAGCEIAAECGDADEALRAVCEHMPDIVLLDVSMPGGGIQVASRIAAACPAVRILMLTVSEDERDVMDALAAGACGYVLKGIGGDELAEIIKSVHEGAVYVSPGLAAQMLVDLKDKRDLKPADLFADLTAREEQILKRVAQGLSNKEIALALTLSEKTVKHYMTNVLRKLQVRNRVEAAIKARDHFSDD